MEEKQMAAFGIEGSGDIAGVAGVGTGGNAQSWQSLFDWFWPMGVFGVGGPGTGADAPTGGYGVCGLGYSPFPLQPVPLNPKNAVGVYGQGGAGDSTGVVGVGTGSAPGISGIAEPNTLANGTGVVGTGGLSTGIGVWGSGGSEGLTATPPPGNAIGVFGAGGTGDSDGVYGVGSGHGYGGQFASGFAPMRLVPASAGTGHPTGAPHNVGEFYVDSHGSLFYCRRSGTPGTWVKLA
jgi:hypothetical protein